MKAQFLLLYLLIIFSSCIPTPTPDPDPCPPDCPEPDYPLEILWESYFYPDTTWMSFSAKPIAYKNTFLYVGNDSKEWNDHAFMFDKDNGEIIHRFDLGSGMINIYNHYLISSSGTGIYIYDLDNFQLLKYVAGIFSDDVSLIGNDMYIAQIYGSLPSADSSAIIKFEIPSMKSERILSITPYTQNDYATLNAVSSEIISGDTILYGTTDDSGPFKVFAYNTTKKNYIWTANITDHFAYFNAPVIDEERMYITWKSQAYAFNKFTGELIWKTPLTNYYRGIKPLLVNDKLYLKAQNYHLYCLDTKTGKVVWHNDKAGNSATNTIVHFDSYIFYLDEVYFRVIDMKTGKVLATIKKGPHQTIDLDHLEESKKLYAKFTKALPYIDKETNIIYFPDHKRMYAFKIPDDWSKI